MDTEEAAKLCKLLAGYFKRQLESDGKFHIYIKFPRRNAPAISVDKEVL